MKTPSEKWHVALLAAVFWLTVPLFNAAYYIRQQANHAYPTNADNIAIPIFSETIVSAVATPVYALFAWLVVRPYRGGQSFWAFDTDEPVRAALATLFWGGLAAIGVYGLVDSALAYNWIDMVSYLPWIYLFLCLRGSFSAPQDEDE